MNSLSPFVRKVIYISTIGLLLIPLSLVSRPETRDFSEEGQGKIADAGGVLSRLRDANHLSQAQLSEIDPASETMKLASLGLRGVAVNVLWMQANEHKKKENYEQLASTLKALTKIQPNFVQVWKFQAHNLAYNVSMEFDDYEYRYHWVKKGLAFLKEGIAYNKTDHRITDELGFFTGNKIGKSDEKDSFRRMFREDDEFHEEMSEYIEPELYDTRDYGPDNWKMAYEWYNRSRQLVDLTDAEQRISDMMFYMYRPSQLRNQGMSLQTEYRTDEIIQEIWRTSHDAWLEYGEEPISNTLGITISLEGMIKKEKELQRFRSELDELVPDVRKEMMDEVMALAGLSDEELYAYKLPLDERNDEQIRIARRVNEVLFSTDSQLDERIAQKAKPADQLQAKRLAEKIDLVIREMRTIDRDSGTINYTFWKARTAAEASDIGMRARQALFDAEEMKRRSIYDDEFFRDFKTKKITVTKKGAISLYLGAFSLWHDVLDEYPDLKEGPLADELADSMAEFKQMLETTNRQWPDDFPLQDLIDARAQDHEPDDLPTTEVQKERSSVLESIEELEPKSEPESETETNPTTDSEGEIDSGEKAGADEAADSDKAADTDEAADSVEVEAADSGEAADTAEKADSGEEAQGDQTPKEK